MVPNSDAAHTTPADRSATARPVGGAAMNRDPVAPPGRAGLVGATLATLVLLALLLALGVWQVERLAWKTALIATVNERTTAPPIPLPPEADWASLKPEHYAYRHVTVTGTFENDKEARVLFPLEEAKGPFHGLGYLIFTPMRLPSGGVVMINRGFVPEDRSAPATRALGLIEGPTTVTGLMREPESPHWFTLAPELNKRLWFVRDPSSMAAGLGLKDVAPFTIDADAHQARGGLPQGGETVISFPNNHLLYAITWFGTALVLLVFYGVYLWRVRHPAPP